MKRRMRIRWLLKWTGTVACGLILGGTPLSFVWTFALVNRNHISVGINSGAFYKGWPVPSTHAAPSVFVLYEGCHTWSELSDRATRYAMWPKSFSGRTLFDTLPLWIPFILLAIPTALLWRADRRRPLPGHCKKCSYNLTGNVSGRCPECGEPIEPATGEQC